MKWKKLFSILLLFCLIITSCKKSFLDIPSKSFRLRQSYVTDLSSTGDFLNGIYIVLGEQLFHGYNQIYPELIADNLKASTSTLNAHYNWSQETNNDPDNNVNMNMLWQYAYQIISSCNFVLEKAEEYRSQDPAKADDMKGQSLAIRALSHLILINVFAQPYNFTADASHLGIPYILTYDLTFHAQRNKISEVYTNIITDLSNAIQLLPQIPSTVPLENKSLVMNRNAAKALLARVYLFKRDFTSAKNLALEVVSSTPLLSISQGYPANIFKLMPPSSPTEALFQIPPSWNTVPAAGGSYRTFFAGFYFSRHFFVATNDIVSILQEESLDVRNVWVTKQSSGSWDVTKYPTNVISGFPAAALAYYPSIVRSSEMYLTAAECYAKLNDDANAKAYLDSVRLRANPSAIATTAIGQALLDSIYKERRKELAFEGLRMFDIQRWEKGVARTDANPGSPNTLPFPNNKTVAPIPGTDVSVGGMTQNPGY